MLPSIGQSCCVYLAVVMEYAVGLYLAAEVLELPGNAVRDKIKTRVIPRHLSVVKKYTLKWCWLRTYVLR